MAFPPQQQQPPLKGQQAFPFNKATPPKAGPKPVPSSVKAKVSAKSAEMQKAANMAAMQSRMK